MHVGSICRKEIALKLERRYLVAVALLAVLTVAFGLAGTVMPKAEENPPMHSSLPLDGVAHFQNPPTYDSDWVDITDKCGQYFNMTHSLNSTDVVVDITGRTLLDDGVHQKHLGLTSDSLGWSKAYGGAEQTDRAYSMVHTSDGGYALVGYTLSFGAGSRDFWLVKTDQNGNVLWNKTYGGILRECAYSGVETSDGGYAMAGFVADSGAPIANDFWLVKTDSNGNTEWNKTYGEAYDDDWAFSVVQTGDEGYALAGYTMSYGAGDHDFWLIKTDSAGNVMWNKTFGGTGRDEAYCVVQTNDGGYALAGWTWSFGAGGKDLWLIKTDADGNAQWNKTYGGTGDESAQSVIQTLDGGYAIASDTTSYGAGYNDFWLIKTDTAGNEQWNQTYGGTEGDFVCSLIQTSDGGYALAGSTGSYGAGSSDFWLVKTNGSGNVQWNQTYGGSGLDEACSVVQMHNDGYALAGWTNSFGPSAPPHFNVYLVKTDAESGLAWIDSTNNTITLYRGSTDPYWNYVRVRIWLIQEPTWQFGDINQDGAVDAQDLWILSQNYGWPLSLLSLVGIIGILGVQTYKSRTRPE